MESFADHTLTFVPGFTGLDRNGTIKPVSLVDLFMFVLSTSDSNEVLQGERPLKLWNLIICKGQKREKIICYGLVPHSTCQPIICLPTIM